jgi:hypothetical protein
LNVILGDDVRSMNRVSLTVIATRRPARGLGCTGVVSGNPPRNLDTVVNLTFSTDNLFMQLYQSIGAALLVTALASSAHPQSAPLPEWKLQASRDSFVVNIQGKTMGYSVHAVEPMPGGGFRITEQTEIGDVMSQKTELLLDAAQRITQVNQSGKMRGHDARIAVEYGGGNVKGAATVPGPEGVQTFTIDTRVPANVIDDNLLHSIFPVLPWSADANWSIPVFSAGKNRLHTITLVATGSEAVTTASGNVDAYRAELRTAEMTVAIWLSKAAPHRVLKTAAVGAPLELVRAN